MHRMIWPAATLILMIVSFGAGRVTHGFRPIPEIVATLPGDEAEFSRELDAPRLPKFLERHPALRIDLGINDARRDLVADGVDVALRLGPLPDSTAVARKLAQAPRLIAASPAYLKLHGWPRNPGDLAAHAVIIGPVGIGPNAWSFTKDGRRTSVRIEGQLTTAANEGATAAAVAGLGITLTSLWGCRAELERGDLAQIIEDWTMEPMELHALFPAGRAASPAARAFIDYLAPQL